MEIIAPYGGSGCPSTVLFDFDGTLSTLRHGWESVMEPMMLQMIAGCEQPGDLLRREVREYIDSSTGIQTIHQMKWLAAKVRECRPDSGLPDDPWWYKSEYNARLMEPVSRRILSIHSGAVRPDDFLMAGGRAFLAALKVRGVKICVASGTDHRDVVREAEVLGVSGYFDEIAGAPEGQESCSKEAVLNRLVGDDRLAGSDLAVIGDGKVEIMLGRALGARALGLASDEEACCGVNPVKRDRLIRAGAHAIVGDFRDVSGILAWMGFSA